MKNLLLLIVFIPLCVTCKKEQAEPGEPLVQYHFINLVDESGENLFATNQISTSEFSYGFSYNMKSWKELMTEKESHILYIREESLMPDTLEDILEKNEHLLLEEFQGEKEKMIFINGEEHTFKLSPLKDGFYQNDQALEYSTVKLDEDYVFYLHHVVLEDY